MAEIRIRPENGHDARTILDVDEQVTFLEGHGLGFERWAIERFDANEARRADDEQAYILGLFSEEVARVKATRDYAEADVIALYPDTPNLDTILQKFDKEHFHTDDEVRFVVAGRGVFTIHSKDDNSIFDVEVVPGDLLVVPEGTLHWFELCEDRTIQCIRLFKDRTGWTPHYTKLT